MPIPLSTLLDGWDGQQTSIAHAVAPLTPAQLAWRPGPKAASAGELARHIAFGRLTWFFRLHPPGGEELMAQLSEWHTDSDGNRHVREDAYPITERADELVRWLELGWALIDRALRTWTVDDLARTYRHKFFGTIYSVSYQWTIYRILTHDVHHGGQLALILGLQGIAVPELGDWFGHLTMPPVVEEA